MNSKRPVNLDLRTIKLPLPAYTSILHRISGVILFVGIAFLLCALDSSLSSEEGFNSVKETMSHPFAKFITWGLLSALIYHFVAGVKHLLLDIDIADGKESGLLASKVTLAVSVLLILIAGVWVW
ncbi:succinate dehydrogenase, cytochrome b556 subunit [Endozoicomonas sp. SM1973]|uniref:Succinate dehydrogenase cytochrome b556 subunit n=1 Tax=Spartinivicinus marinus TaxID=2994442 RepID=A0A853HZ40_9GAMM|nr:succinate dehydrogenase, cytochrome b556 subunit [Spartinivicinus marinus]NYZ66453.1 succinate dehydrogenase, cytochrome b556 subunit [Spartinivicinus marinus]